MQLSRTCRVMTLAIMTVASAAPLCATELYRWVDERGIVNYSNEPPPKGSVAKDVRGVEDRLSVYTPEERLQAPPPPVSAPAAGGPRQGVPEQRAIAPQSVAPPTPCVSNPSDPNCYPVLRYDDSPVFIGRQRSPRVVQPQLPPGTTAGNVTGSTGYIPGQSAGAPAPSPDPRASRPRQPGGSFTQHDRERDSRR